MEPASTTSRLWPPQQPGTQVTAEDMDVRGGPVAAKQSL